MQQVRQKSKEAAAPRPSVNTLKMLNKVDDLFD